ncbi:MAG: metal-dependent hydrolase [Dehalococcoidia bacterium]
MAGLAGHAIAGVAIAGAANLSRRQTALAVALALLPDADVLAGLARKGDGETWHRGPWSHSPVAAAAVAGAVFLGSVSLGAARNGATDYRVGLKGSALTWALLMSHVALDFWLVNPLEVGGPPPLKGLHHLPGLIRHQLSNLPGDAIFYGAIGYGLYKGYGWLRRRLAPVRRALPGLR